jgi:hypothetical protein
MWSLQKLHLFFADKKANKVTNKEANINKASYA